MRRYQGLAILSDLTIVDSKVGNPDSKIKAVVDIVCTTCYIKGTATAQLITSDDFNLTQALEQFISSVENDITTITDEVVSDLETWAEGLEGDFVQALKHDNATEFIDGLTFPTLNGTNFDIELPPIPKAQLTFRLDGVDIYVALNTNLSAASYTFTIYEPATPVGIHTDDGFLGIFFKVDLILSSTAPLDMSSGFHIKLNDGFAIDIPLFSNKVSKITKWVHCSVLLVLLFYSKGSF